MLRFRLSHRSPDRPVLAELATCALSSHSLDRDPLKINHLQAGTLDTQMESMGAVEAVRGGAGSLMGLRIEGWGSKYSGAR